MSVVLLTLLYENGYFQHFLSNFQVAENIKEFFHKEGIHSTTIQPEFVDYHPTADSKGDEDCVLNCPPGPGSIPAPACEASKCCPPASTTTASNGNLKNQTSKSAQNTPTRSRSRPTSFHDQEVVNGDSEERSNSYSASNLEVVNETTPMHALEDNPRSTSASSWH